MKGKYNIYYFWLIRKSSQKSKKFTKQCEVTYF